MAKLIIHNPPLSQEELAELRLKRTLALNPYERMKIAEGMMAFCLRLKNARLRQINNLN